MMAFKFVTPGLARVLRARGAAEMLGNRRTGLEFVGVDHADFISDSYYKRNKKLANPPMMGE
jgi:hypothetical protein